MSPSVGGLLVSLTMLAVPGANAGPVRTPYPKLETGGVRKNELPWRQCGLPSYHFSSLCRPEDFMEGVWRAMEQVPEEMIRKIGDQAMEQVGERLTEIQAKQTILQLAFGNLG